MELNSFKYGLSKHIHINYQFLEKGFFYVGKKNEDKQGKFLISIAMMNGLGNHCIKNNKPFSNDGIQNKQN